MFRKILCRTALAAFSVTLSPIICKQNKREVYIWGNGVYQARPDALLQFKNFIPKKIQGLPQNLVSLQFGQYYEAGIDADGQLYIWQKHSPDANYDKDHEDSRRNQIRLLQKNIKSVRFTNGYIWTMTKDEKVYQWPIHKKFDENQQLISKYIGDKRQVAPLKGTIQLETGRDHVLALNNKGLIYAMGDDTYGQCGQAGTDRKNSPPFAERRVTYPTQVKNIKDIVKISAGRDHNIALDRLGNLFGWGSNSNIQLSHEEQFSKMNDPLICSFTPLKINKNLDYSEIKDIKTGDQYCVFVTENRQTGSSQVFSVGTNLRGQLGIDEIKHVKDISKIQKLSNYVLKINNKETKVQIDQVQCGSNHCIALLNIGYVMLWGDNQHGQMGNKKRSPAMAPLLLRNLTNDGKKKVVGVFASENNSGVIIQEINE